jgi:hypothetical protein
MEENFLSHRKWSFIESYKENNHLYSTQTRHTSGGCWAVCSVCEPAADVDASLWLIETPIALNKVRGADRDIHGILQVCDALAIFAHFADGLLTFSCWLMPK